MGDLEGHLDREERAVCSSEAQYRGEMLRLEARDSVKDEKSELRLCVLPPSVILPGTLKERRSEREGHQSLPLCEGCSSFLLSSLLTSFNLLLFRLVHRFHPA